MTTAIETPVFRFDAEAHIYTLDGVLISSVTQLLTRAGHIDARWYTESSRERGHRVHQLCADYDLGVLDVKQCNTEYRNQLLAYVAFERTVRPAWISIEEARGNAMYRFGGRPDRVGIVYGCEAIVELKNGAMEPWHGYQTALYDILLGGLPDGVRKRYGLYLKSTGKFRLVPHDGSELRCSRGRGDYDVAFNVIRQSQES